MNNLIDRLKITTVATAAKPKKLPPSIKIPGPTPIKVTPIVEPSVGTPEKFDTAKAHDFVDACLRNKMAECNLGTDIGVTAALIERYTAEYREFLKKLDSEDFSSAIFGTPAETATVSAPLAQEEVPLANGISVGNEAGGAIVLPTAPKKKARLKKVSAVESADVDKPAYDQIVDG